MELLGGAGGEQEGMFEGDEGEGDEEGDEEGDDLPAGAQVIELTEEERQAVERLAGLGFDPSLALEAYLACDKK